MADAETGEADAALLAGLSTDRVMDCAEAAALVGVSRSTVAAWCREDPQLPHEARPGRRPAQQLSAREVAARALREPTTRRKALAALTARAPGAHYDFAPPPQADARVLPLPAPQPRERPVTDVAGPVGADGPREVDRLRGEVVRLQEQLAHLSDLVEELQASDTRKTSMWLAAVRSSGTPTNAAALDGLHRSGPGGAG
jgi:hypothetical protein